MKKYNYILFILITTTLCIDMSLDGNSLHKPEIETYNSKMNYSENKDHSLLYDYINSDKYITGPGDIFLFNMVTSSRIVNLELIVSPSGTILIPIIGIVNVKDKSLSYVYDAIIKKCKDKYEDANVYVELIKTRFFKVLVTGEFNRSGMFPVSSTNRVSDLIESIFLIQNDSPAALLDSLIFDYLPNFPRNTFLNKEVFLLRNDSLINIDLFSYYTKGDSTNNPTLKEGDIINIKNSDKITVIGEVKNPIRIDKTNNIQYNDVINQAGLLDIDRSIINVINYKVLMEYPKSEIDRINQIDPKYRSDMDDSFLNSSLKANYGVFFINDKKDLSLEPSSGDIIIIKDMLDYVEVIGGVNKPGLYKYNVEYNLDNYIKKAGNFNQFSKNNNLYIINSNDGMRIRVNKNYIPKRGDIIFIEEKASFKSWERFSESIRLAGTLATMSLVLYNIWSDINE
tara:strand:+ start:4150 stop:5511 length:1362 start_codon:yes stop_codon:yes gene_type:complete